MPTGYGRGALEALQSAVARVKRDDPMTPVTMLLPNNVAGVVARRHLAGGLTGETTGVAGLHLVTIGRLADQLASPTLTAAARRPATRPIVAAAWRAALTEDPGIFEPVADHPATIRALTRSHRELRDLSEVALDAVAGASNLGRDLIRLHRVVRHRLTGDWYDTTDVLRAAAELCAGKPDACRALGAIVLYLPQALTRAEAAFASALAARSDLSVLAGLTGHRRADEAVHRSVERLGLALPAGSGPGTPPTASSMLDASDADDEVRCVVRDVVETLTKHPAHRIAVLYGNTFPYGRLLQEHMAAAGIEVNGPGVLSVHERAVSRCLLGILALPDHDMPRGDLFRALAEAPARTTAGELIPVSRWERVSRAAGVVSGDDWRQRLSTYIDRQRAAIETERQRVDLRPGVLRRADREVEAAAALAEFAVALRGRMRAAEALCTWTGLSDWALALFRDLFGDGVELRRLPPEEQHAAAAVQQTLRTLATLDAVDTEPGLTALREVLEMELESALPRIGRFGDGVLVGPVSAAVGLDLDVVYVVGLAEDIVPGRLHEDALLPERVRDQTGGELASYRERLDAEHRHLLAAFASAPRVVATFPRGDLRRHSHRLPSRWLLPSFRALSDNPTLPATGWNSEPHDWLVSSPSYAGTITQTPVPASEQEWRVRTASARHPLHDDDVDRAVTMIRARSQERLTRFDGNLAAVPGLPDYARDERSVSPTSLEAYAVCPHAYFMEHMLHITPVEQPEELVTISALTIGNLMHDSFDALVTEFAGALPSFSEPWTSEHRRRFAEIAETKARELEAEGLTGHPRVWQHERDRILADLVWMLEDDDSWRRERDARTLTSELAFGVDGHDPVMVPIQSGRVLLRGRADKVDRARDGTLFVTDIKTGGSKRFTGIKEEDPVVGGSKLQLPVYAYAARDRVGEPDTPVEAAYWFVRKSRGTRVDVPLTSRVETIYAQTLDAIVSSMATGLFPGRAPDSPDYGPYRQCGYCNPDGLGHGEARTRWERKRGDPALRVYVALAEPEALETEGAD
jgi:hypothetical protein